MLSFTSLLSTKPNAKWVSKLSVVLVWHRFAGLSLTWIQFEWCRHPCHERTPGFRRRSLYSSCGGRLTVPNECPGDWKDFNDSNVKFDAEVDFAFSSVNSLWDRLGEVWMGVSSKDNHSSVLHGVPSKALWSHLKSMMAAFGIGRGALRNRSHFRLSPCCQAKLVFQVRVTVSPALLDCARTFRESPHANWWLRVVSQPLTSENNNFREIA